MEATFNQFLQQQVVRPLLAGGQFPPSPPVAGVPTGAASSIVGARAVQGIEPPSGAKNKDLPTLQIRLVEAKFGHRFELPIGSESDFRAAMRPWRRGRSEMCRGRHRSPSSATAPRIC
eukprot:3736406-Pyramimonas_sp.AAC.1